MPAMFNIMPKYISAMYVPLVSTDGVCTEAVSVATSLAHGFAFNALIYPNVVGVPS